MAGRGPWVTNHLANPVVRPLLRSRLGRRLGRHLALLGYRGRRTGRGYELPVEYARHGDHVWIAPGAPETKTWWRNLRGGAEVDLVLAGERVHGHAEVLDAASPAEEVDAGWAAYLAALPHARRPVEGDVVLVRVDLDR